MYREYNSCLISFLSSRELFPAFICAKIIGNRVKICCGVNSFSPDSEGLKDFPIISFLIHFHNLITFFD